MRKILCFIIIAILLLSVTGCDILSPKEAENKTPDSLMSVHFIDVGQGDSILLESNGEFVLVDAGEYEYGAKVLDFIQSKRANSIKYMIATHPHTDHFGGLRTILNAITAENFITSETDADNSGWNKTLEKAEAMGVNFIYAIPGKKYNFGCSSFTIFGPISDNHDDYNDCSVVIKAECGDISFLLTGDAEHDELHEMLDAGENLSADVLKCGHHGSSDAVNTRFLKAVDPAFAVVSCGKNNDYGHPDKETLELLDILETRLYRTDTDGTISFFTDGRSLYSGDMTYTPDEKSTAPDKLCFIGNKRSMVFHEPTCEGGKKMKEKNMVIIHTWEEAIESGYVPCSQCNP